MCPQLLQAEKPRELGMQDVYELAWHAGPTEVTRVSFMGSEEHLPQATEGSSKANLHVTNLLGNSSP